MSSESGRHAPAWIEVNRRGTPRIGKGLFLHCPLPAISCASDRADEVLAIDRGNALSDEHSSWPPAPSDQTSNSPSISAKPGATGFGTKLCLPVLRNLRVSLLPLAEGACTSAGAVVLGIAHRDARTGPCRIIVAGSNGP